MDLYLIWLVLCGICVNAWMGWRLGRVLGHCAWAACAAASWVRWSYAVGRVHGFRSLRFAPWVYVPEVFARRWLMFLGCDSGDVYVHHTHGCWCGIGNWRVFPVKLQGDA